MVQGFSVDDRGEFQRERNSTLLTLITQAPVGRPEIPLQLRSPSILASITREDGGIIFARYECKVIVRRVGVEDETPVFREWRERAQIKPVKIHDDVQAMVMEGMKMDEDQAWFMI
jgi:hypothetical protein